MPFGAARFSRVGEAVDAAMAAAKARKAVDSFISGV